jgi:hypothetical protein
MKQSVIYLHKKASIAVLPKCLHWFESMIPLSDGSDGDHNIKRSRPFHRQNLHTGQFQIAFDHQLRCLPFSCLVPDASVMVLSLGLLSR